MQNMAKRITIPANKLFITLSMVRISLADIDLIRSARIREKATPHRINNAKIMVAAMG